MGTKHYMPTFKPHIFQPTEISGCVLWLRSDLGITIDTGVSQWADQSGNGNNASQGTGDYQPLLVANQINGHPCIRFDGSNDRMLVSGIAGLLSGSDLPVSVFLVRKFITAGQEYKVSLGWANTGNVYMEWLLWSGSNDPAEYYWSKSTSMFDSLGSVYGEKNTEWTLDEVIDTGTLATIWVNDGSFDTQTNSDLSNPLSVNSFGIGGRLGGVPGAFANIDIAEIIIYNSALSNSDRLKLENYVSSRYGIF